MVIVFLGSVGIPDVSFVCGTDRMVSASMSSDGGMLPFSLGVLQENRDVVSAYMVRFFNSSQGA